MSGSSFLELGAKFCSGDAALQLEVKSLLKANAEAPELSWLPPRQPE